MKIGKGTFWLGECLELMSRIPDSSIDMILCDLPYGTTQNKWDVIVPFKPLWKQYWRVAKTNAAVVLTSQCPFDKLLGASQLHYLKYEWIWEKPKATGHLNAKKQPMKAHENILVFSKNRHPYNPQKTEGKPYKPNGGGSKMDNYGEFNAVREGSMDGSRYPRTVVRFNHVAKPIHPTQKPVELFEYLIKTYTSEGMTVLDNCAGSGTTAVAAERTNRCWICIEREPSYYHQAVERVKNEVQSSLRYDL